MNAYQLFQKGNDGLYESVDMWLCGACNHYRGDQHHAEGCCTCQYCGKPLPYNHSYHYDCFQARQDAIHAERVERSEKLEKWEGWVYLEDYGSNNGFFSSIGELEEELANDVPDFEQKWVFVCIEEPFSGPNINNVIQQIADDGYEDIEHALKGEDALEAAISTFNELNAGLVTYRPDFKRMIWCAPVFEDV